MSVRSIGAVLAVLTVAGCLGSAPPKVVDRLGPEPNVRKVVSERKLFADPEARIVAFSKPRPWRYSTFFGWRACLKAAVPSSNGAPALKTYALFLQSNDLLDRREAIPDDLCASEQFDPFTPDMAAASMPVEPPVAPPPETKAPGGMFDWVKLPW